MYIGWLGSNSDATLVYLLSTSKEDKAYRKTMKFESSPEDLIMSIQYFLPSILELKAEAHQKAGKRRIWKSEVLKGTRWGRAANQFISSG